MCLCVCVYKNIQRADTQAAAFASITRARRPLVPWSLPVLPPYFFRAQKTGKEKINNKSRMDEMLLMAVCLLLLLLLFNISHIVCTQRGAININISLSIFTDVHHAGAFYFHLDVIKDRIYLYICVYLYIYRYNNIPFSKKVSRTFYCYYSCIYIIIYFNRNYR